MNTRKSVSADGAVDPRDDWGAPRVLIAEDDHDLRSAMIELLESHGLIVVGVETGDAFFQRLEPVIVDSADRQTPDVIVTDIKMPGIPPIEVVEGLIHVGMNVPTIVVSGCDSIEIRRRAAANGIPWLDKPLDLEMFEEAVRRALLRRYRRLARLDTGAYQV